MKMTPKAKLIQGLQELQLDRQSVILDELLEDLDAEIRNMDALGQAIDVLCKRIGAKRAAAPAEIQAEIDLMFKMVAPLRRPLMPLW